MAEDQEREIEVTTVETVHRKYTVLASGDDAAKARLNLWFKDPEVLKDGVVTKLAAETLQSRKIIAVDNRPVAVATRGPRTTTEASAPTPPAGDGGHSAGAGDDD